MLKGYLIAALLGALAPVAMAEEFEDRIGDYNACIVLRIEAMQNLCEPVDMIATAIVAGCPEQLNDFYSAAIRRYGVDGANKLRDQLKAARREYVIMRLMEHRAVSPCP
jgi:hypothetical protein